MGVGLGQSDCDKLRTNNNNNNTLYRMRSLALLTLLGTCLGQKPARIGPDGKPLLNRPDVNECMKRKSHMKVGNHNYFLSWREPWHKFEDWDWFNGRNFCRDRCMDLVSFNTPGEFKMFEEIMRRDNVTSIYTSGRKCNFQNKGCDGAHLQPINVNGWFWAGANNDRIPPTNQPHPDAFWSPTGETGKPQPDNDEGTKAIDVDSLPHLPELNAPVAPVQQQQPVRQQAQTFVNPPSQFAPQSQFQNAGQFQGAQPPPQFNRRPIAPRPPPTRPSRNNGVLGNLFGNFRLPFF